MRSSERAQEALKYGHSATRFDPSDSRAQLCLGWAYAMAGQHDRAAIHHALASELNENDPWTLLSSALGFAFRSDYRKARELANRALTLTQSPNSAQWCYQSMIRFLCMDFDDCIEAAKGAEAAPPLAHIFVWKSCALLEMNKPQDAKFAVERFYSETASRWFGKVPATRADMTKWFLQAFPIEKQEEWGRLRDGLARAGAPTAHISHNAF